MKKTFYVGQLEAISQFENLDLLAPDFDCAVLQSLTDNTITGIASNFTAKEDKVYCDIAFLKRPLFVDELLVQSYIEIHSSIFLMFEADLIYHSFKSIAKKLNLN